MAETEMKSMRPAVVSEGEQRRVKSPMGRPGFTVTTAMMGYGHMRAADNLASRGYVQVMRVDKPPLVGTTEDAVWKGTQWGYHTVSRLVEGPWNVLWKVLERMEEIPEDSRQASLWPSRAIEAGTRAGLWQNVAAAVQKDGLPVVHCFYLPALVAAYHGCTNPNWQLLCDVDFHRIWVPTRADKYRLEYCVPTPAGADRLMSYGVPSRAIHVTGFPLPVSLTGGEDLATRQAHVDARLTRLSPDSNEPFSLLFAISGAGCYLDLLEDLVRSLVGPIRDGEVNLRIAAGSNTEIRDRIQGWLSVFGLAQHRNVKVLFRPDVFDGLHRFNRAIPKSDILITKPGELVFYTGLGIPEVLLPPVGQHEDKNRRYLLDNGCAADYPGPENLLSWLREARRAGLLADLASNGAARIPATGTHVIHGLVRHGDSNSL